MFENAQAMIHPLPPPAGDKTVSHQKKIQHLYLRAGFGETPYRIESIKNSSIDKIVDELFASSQEYKDINYLPYPLNESQEMKGASPGKVIKIILKSKQDMEELNTEWIFKLTHTKAVLREKMTFFWHNHFATSTLFAYLMQLQNNTLRKYALSSFKDMLHAIAKDPAMIIYLNNQQNRKGHPNENFAREVMELFTLGIGNYSEDDIKEAARAFTGWAINGKGEFEFNTKQHDDGEKTFLGNKGNFNGDDILNILLEQKQTAKHVVTKIYREFVNPEVDDKRVDELATLYYDSGYDTSKLMRNIFTSEWFYDPKNIGVKISSPVELIVRYKKLVALEFKKPKQQLELQKALGQVLFFPPNVAGWKGGTNWIDSASLLIRLSIPQYILTGELPAIKAKPHFEEAPEEGIEKVDGERVTCDWSDLKTTFDNKSDDQILDALIQCNASRIDRSSIHAQSTIKTVANIMSLPEFQLI